VWPYRESQSPLAKSLPVCAVRVRCPGWR